MNGLSQSLLMEQPAATPAAAEDEEQLETLPVAATTTRPRTIPIAARVTDMKMPVPYENPRCYRASPGKRRSPRRESSPSCCVVRRPLLRGSRGAPGRGDLGRLRHTVVKRDR